MSSPENLLANASVHKSEILLFHTLLQLTIIVLAGRVGSALALRCGQSAAVGEIIIGILLGPSLFGLLAPGIFNTVFHSITPEPMQVLSQIGLILLMFQIGCEFDFNHLRDRTYRKATIYVAVAAMVVPFGLGLAFGYYTAPLLSPNASPWSCALFIATAFSITALPVLGRIMIEFKLTRHPIGVIAISAAAINDVVGWLLLALVTTLALANFDAGEFGFKVLAVFVFLLLAWFLVRPLLKRAVRSSQARMPLSNNLMGGLLVLIFLGAMTTYQLGIFAIFGGFVAGMLLYDEPTLIDAWKERIGHFVTTFFLPIFFTYTGLRTDIGGLDTAELWFWCGVTILLATIGKFGAGYLAARMARLGHVEAKIIGIMMNTRALMELIVINVGYDLGVISQNVFTMLVLMAIVSTVITTPALRRWLPQIGHRETAG